MRLIVETGSFGTEWAIIDSDQVISTAKTEVINPFLQSRREISRLVRLNLPEMFFHQKYEKVYYYGAGCGTEERKRIVEASFTTQFKSQIVVDSTLLAAARGLLQNIEGIACILGNNSGSCHYDGKNIVASVMSGGYLLGDEGSATVLGRLFLSDVLKCMAPTELIEAFYEEYEATPFMLQNLVYEHLHPEHFLASVCVFLKGFQKHEYVQGLVKRNFRDFFSRCVQQYEHIGLPFCSAGHMACDFLPLLNEVAKEFDANFGNLVEMTPMKGLLDYHLKNG